MKSAFIANTALLSVLLSGHALADGDCSEPVSDWQPRETLRHQVEQQYGWSVQRIKVDDGCYKLKGADRKGNAIEARYAPASLRLRTLQVNFGDDGDARDYLAGSVSK
ncbi:PepSY domain-containing protein [Pseudomonas sp. CCI1.2]|uniref:PepSY domain-containing protein n=1 Tax=unclassified Pseudomonas TaxID=196821 RepID=UPI002AC94077|nr:MULTISPECIES: PepSY domain-containing protein [unclassified Pseudomonas]MEB0092536.1 PepSY domain-containing protein [Pseudomonas sp. CCI4.2]MEB0122206.1 PepSY domain-containing protein [Pseudomonas sp. CCI1.2]WPX55166.1 PepSY domain-containing protein [Pseudomonas sp. CCI4.2]